MATKSKKRSASHKPLANVAQVEAPDMALGYAHPDLEFDVTIVTLDAAVVVWCWGGLNQNPPRMLGKINYAPGDDFGSLVANVGGTALSEGTAWVEIRNPQGELLLRGASQPFSE